MKTTAFVTVALLLMPLTGTAEQSLNAACPNSIDTIVAKQNADGTTTVTLILSLNADDNSYGENAVGGSKRKFKDYRADNAEFVITNGNAQTVLHFRLDYLSADPGAPSGYDSLGPDGGDGQIISGDGAHILSWSTSLAENLNERSYFAGGVQTTSGPNNVNLLNDSPPTVNESDYTLATPNPWASGWEFASYYRVTVSSAAFGPSGFGGVLVASLRSGKCKG